MGIAGRDGIDPIVDFIDKFDVGSFDHVVDESGAIWANFEIVSQPSFIFVAASGAATSHLGALGVGGMSERLDALLAQ